MSEENKTRNYVWREANKARNTRWGSGPHGDNKKEQSKKERKDIKKKLREGEEP